MPWLVHGLIVLKLRGHQNTCAQQSVRLGISMLVPKYIDAPVHEDSAPGS